MPAPKRRTQRRRSAAPKRILNCKPSQKTDDDFTFDHAAATAAVAKAPKIPPSKDLREDWWQIGNQGSTGACVGWATADSVLSWHFVKSGQIQKDEMLSPRFTRMAAKETDEFAARPTTFIETDGTSLKAALDVAQKLGVVRDSVLPFSGGMLYQDEQDVFYAICARLQDRELLNLGINVSGWRKWLATKGPILTHWMSMRPGTMPRARAGTWMSTSRKQGGAGTPSRLWATRRIASSSATAGARISGATRGSRTRAFPMRKPRLQRPTASRSSGAH